MFDDLFKGAKPEPKQIGSSTALIKSWALKHWKLPEDTTLLVSELQCGESDCPDIETVIAILAVAGTDKTVKLDKPIYEIKESDIKEINIWRDSGD